MADQAELMLTLGTGPGQVATLAGAAQSAYDENGLPGLWYAMGPGLGDTLYGVMADKSGLERESLSVPTTKEGWGDLLKNLGYIILGTFIIGAIAYAVLKIYTRPITNVTSILR